MYTRQRWSTRSPARSEGSLLLGERTERHKGQPAATHTAHRPAPQQGVTSFSTVQVRLHEAHDKLISDHYYRANLALSSAGNMAA